MTTNPWEINEVEYQKNVQLFNQLTGGQPYMDAVTARNALMRSNLPAPTLAQIWNLADIDRDGRLDIREYSIAMRLAFNCIAGMPVPPQLPPTLLVVPAARPMSIPSTPTAIPHQPPPPPMMNSWTASRQNSADPFTTERRMSTQSYGSGPIYPSTPVQVPTVQSRTNSISGASSSPADRSVFDGRQLENWAIPHHNKLKYSQLFNQLDKDRVGFLSAAAGRSALGLSGLATNALAHIWFLSDVNKDGKLSVDEYCISQFMIEMFKAGYALPRVTPPELVRMCGMSRSANNTPELEPGAEPPQKSPAPKTFEDKRQDNLAKGQAELERRRQILMEEENRRREEIAKREREEEAKRERERQEKERQMELERQAEMERQRILELEREELEKKRRAELEKKREEEEQQRKLAAEKAKLKTMQSQRQQESERLAQRQQREKTLGFQLQALDEKVLDIETDIGKAKEAVVEVTRSIENMRGDRDTKVQRIQELQKENQQLAIESQEMGHQLLQMQSAHKETTSRKMELENLKRKRDAMQKAIEEATNELVAEKEKVLKQKAALQEKEAQYNETVRANLLARREEYRKVFELLVHAQKQAQSKMKESTAAVAMTNGAAPKMPPQADAFADFDNAASSQFDAAFGASAPIDPFADVAAAAAAPPPHDASTSSAAAAAATPSIPNSQTRRTSSTQIDAANGRETSKCRALFAFEARSEDELSFEPGDVIIVFESHSAEPGWRAGQLREKVGWFPEAFVEAIAAMPQHGNEPPIQNMPPNVTPSSSLNKIPEEGEAAARKAEIAKIMESPVRETPTTAICQCVAQFQWRARNEDDLSFSKGDIIDVTEKQEMKWKGRKSNGECGWFPKSYVKVVGSGEATPTNVTSPTKPAPPTQMAAQYDVVPAEMTMVTNGDLLAGQELYVAIYDFEAVEPTDLSLKVGDSIVVLEKNDEWWKGKCNGKEGIFPANYVEKAPTPTAGNGQQQQQSATSPTVICHARAIVDFVSSAPNQLAIKIGDLIKVREKSGAGWWEGEMIRDGVAVAGWFPGDYVKVVEEAPGAKTSISDGMAHQTAIVLYDYKANQQDELDLSVGDVVVVNDKSDAEWWTGHKLNNPTILGLFPANYVQLQ